MCAFRFPKIYKTLSIISCHVPPYASRLRESWRMSVSAWNDILTTSCMHGAMDWHRHRLIASACLSLHLNTVTDTNTITQVSYLRNGVRVCWSGHTWKFCNAARVHCSAAFQRTEYL